MAKWVDATFEMAEVEPASAGRLTDTEGLARRLANNGDRVEVRRALVKAGASDERAVRKLLAVNADGTVLAACDVLTEIGTAESVPALRKLADDTTSKAVRIEAASAADAIEKRLAGTK